MLRDSTLFIGEQRFEGFDGTLAERHAARPLVFGRRAVDRAAAFAGSRFWPAFILLVTAGGGMYAPYGPFVAWIADRLP